MYIRLFRLIEATCTAVGKEISGNADERYDPYKKVK